MVALIVLALFVSSLSLLALMYLMNTGWLCSLWITSAVGWIVLASSIGPMYQHPRKAARRALVGCGTVLAVYTPILVDFVGSAALSNRVPMGPRVLLVGAVVMLGPPVIVGIVVGMTVPLLRQELKHVWVGRGSPWEDKASCS